MFIELLIALVLGICAGTATGLIPGFHINLVSIMIVSFASYLLKITSLPALATFIIAMAITHTFLDVLPAIFLGAPDSDTALGVLPGHRLLLEGKGFEAIKLTVIGSLLSLLAAVSLFPIFILAVPIIYATVQPYIAYLLILVVIVMIFLEQTFIKKMWSLLVFFLAGTLGVITLTLPNLNQPLFPLFSGLFGTSMLLVSLSNNTKIPEQKITDSLNLTFSEKIRSIAAATFSGSFVSFFPGLGPAQAAIIGNIFAGNLTTYAFLILIGGINTVNMLVSLVSFYTIDKARNGAVLAIKELIAIDTSLLLILISTALIVAGIATCLTLFLARVFANVIQKVNYSMMCIIVIIFIVTLVIYISSWLGLLILVVATAIGIIPNIIDVKRSHAMGSLILPVILFFLL